MTLRPLLLVLAGTAALTFPIGTPVPVPRADVDGEGRVGIRTDSVLYRLIPDTRWPGAHRLRLLVSLTNRTRDTVLLSFPCHFGPRPARTFIFADNLSFSPLGIQACLASVAGFGADTHGFALPPRATLIDTVTVQVPAYRQGSHEVRLEQYLGTYRLAYHRRIRRGFFRRYWTSAPLSETLSNTFRVDRPQ